MNIEFRPLDVLVILIYLLGMAGVGYWFSRRNKSTEDYFLGGRAFPGWAIGLSMMGTSISSVTFLALPGTAFKGNWSELTMNLMLPFIAVLAILYFVPLFRQAGVTSAFEYLERRFGPVARLYGTISFILLQLIRLGLVLSLVSLPVSLLTGVSMNWVILAVGIFIAFYTVAGGFEAVIWTDVVQAIVLIFGGLLCFLFITFNLPDGFGQVLSVGGEANKFSLGSADFNLNERTIWTVALLGIFNWLAYLSSDQNVVQRYVASKSDKEARKATTLYAAIAVPTWAFFFLIGTCVYVWYQQNPDPALDEMQADQVFPYFILTTIPAGLAGLTIAGVLAAAMSSLDSSINAIATVTTVDILKPWLAKGRDDQYYLKTARWIAIAAAGFMIIGAMIIHSVDKQSMNDLNLIMTSVFGGCLVGLFLVGFFCKGVDSLSALVALGVSITLNIYLGFAAAGWLPAAITPPLHNYWVAIVVNLVFVAVALGLSRFRPQDKDLDGLTIWTIKKP